MTPAWLAGPDSRSDGTTLRFLITGASAAGLFFVLSFAAVRSGLPPFAGTMLAYGVTFVASYTAQQAWTFRGRSRHFEALPRYLAVQVACGLGSATLARFLVDDFGYSAQSMAAVTTLASSAVSYGLSRWWVFAGKASDAA